MRQTSKLDIISHYKAGLFPSSLIALFAATFDVAIIRQERGDGADQ